MHCLYGLQQAGYVFQLKGGTSLSKGFGLIHRFSEDIDLCITPPESLGIRTGKNHDRNQHRLGRKGYFDDLAKEINIEDIKVIRYSEFDDVPKYRNGGIQLKYEPCIISGETTAKEWILLELGLGEISPTSLVEISSWIFDRAVEQGFEFVDNRAKDVHCYQPGFTLVEKLQAISTKFRKMESKNVLIDNFTRHYYDVVCLLKNESVRNFSQTDAFEAHRQKHFPASDRNIPLSENPAYLLTDSAVFQKLKKEYEKEIDLYYKGQPDFEEVISTIRDWLIRP